METLPFVFEETTVVPPVHGVDPDTELLHAKTLTLDEASAMGTVGGSKSESKEPEKPEDSKEPEPKDSKDQGKPEAELAVGTKDKDANPTPPPNIIQPVPRPPILNDISAVTPEEQRGPKPKGEGRGRGRGRGGRKGKGKGKKQSSVEEQEDEEDQNIPPETTKPKRKKSTACPAVPSATAGSSEVTPKDSKGGQKRKRATPVVPKDVELKDDNPEKEPKDVGDSTEGPKTKKSRVKSQPKKIAAKPKDPKGKKPDLQKELGQEVLDRKAQVSRKSSAYHCAKRLALKEGKSNEEALRLAKLAPRLSYVRNNGTLWSWYDKVFDDRLYMDSFHI